MKYNVALNRYSIYIATSSLIIVICTSILVNYFISNQSKLSRSESRVRQATQFVWSHEINDWTLSLHFQESSSARGCIWPDDCPLIESQDRIINQLLLNQAVPEKVFKILPPKHESYPLGQDYFIDNNCAVSDCLITDDYTESDALIFSNAEVKLDPHLIQRHRASQIWIAYLLESPPNTFDRRFPRKHRGQGEFNWTATYRSDSDIVTPYSKFVPYHETLQEYLTILKGQPSADIQKYFDSATDKHKTLIEKKSGKVAWFVSNCNAKNNRFDVARKLNQYIQVDIYGNCGNLTCSKKNDSDCMQMLNENYKFYLAFENSNNRDYVTEKLFKNALGYNDPSHLVLPIVLGPSRRDYERLAPPGSFIHVDDFQSIESLANYLIELDKDDAKYYAYFRWKLLVQFIDSKFLCRVCALLHETNLRPKTRIHKDIQTWWLEDR